jgi:plasmid replication initiation protein
MRSTATQSDTSSTQPPKGEPATFPTSPYPFGAEVVLKKAVDTLAIIPTNRKISLLARKVYNVMIYYAQKQGDREIYRVRLRDVINAIEFNSNNTEVLKEHLRQMVMTKVEWQSPTQGEGARWGVSGLISHAELINEGGEVLMEWSYAPKLKQAILDPQRYARFSLAMQIGLRTSAALVLYEICSRYVDNPGGVTARQHWTWWRPVLTGVPDDQSGAYKEWKYFSRDVIKLAVAEVSQVTELSVEPVEYRRGRAVTDLQFRVKRKQQQRLPLTSVLSPVDLNEVGRAIRAGVEQSKAERLLEKFGIAAFANAVDTLEARKSRRDLEIVSAPAQFLGAILSNSAVSQKPGMALKVVGPQQTKKAGASRVALLEQYREQKKREAEELYAEVIDSEKSLIKEKFEASVLPGLNAAIQRSYRTRGMASGVARLHFTNYLADHFFGEAWGAPGDTELLNYSLKT